MTRFTADSRDRVRDAVDMIAVVSNHTELRRAGTTEYVGRCPFHDERTPSFGVNPVEKVYYCFGCQASGDVFRFVMETEGLDFPGALQSLADRFGVELQTEQEDPQAAERRQRRERLQSLLGRAAEYYARYLWEAREAAPARDYLQTRGLREETLRTFRVGYAPSAWDRMLTASRRAGFTDEDLLVTGLAQRSQNRPGQIYDRFRERIMFPSTDARSNVIGFGARAMRDNQRPKYLNTAESELYRKREVLFGLDRARAAASRIGNVILVEGYTDVLALHQAGLANAVGIMGTALTEEQIRQLERVAKVLVLCLDSDRAGQEAMLRAAQVTDNRNLELRVVPLPEGTDPAELIERAGVDALRERVDASVPFVKFHVERILERNDTSSAEGRDRAFRDLQPALRDLPKNAFGQDLLQRVAGRLELSEARLATLIESSGRHDVALGGAGHTGPAGSGAPTNGGGGGGEPLDQGLRAERTFLALCVARPQAGARMLFEIDLEGLITSEVMRRAARHLTGRTQSPLADLPDDDDALARVVADLVSRAGRAGSVSDDQLEHARLVLEQARIDRAIRRAKSEGGAGIAELAREREAVMAARRTVYARLERAI
ncbi:MAG TPA: DNA primase [Solirubrobacteraceae bacterium]|nr:DNA primase [Solirubrobacteraceae bacterium]